MKRLRAEWLRQHRWPAGLLAAVGLGVVGILGVLARLDESSRRAPFVLGLVGGALVASILAALFVAFLAHDKNGINQLRGAWGEENTRDVLASAKRRRHIIGWIDSLGLQYGDLDHLVVTQSGEVVLIDSKWRSEGNAQSASEMAAVASRGRQRAEAVLRSTLRAERGVHRARGISTPVSAIVVIWGAAQVGLQRGVTIDGIEFVAGRDLRSWLRGRGRSGGSRHAARHALALLEEFRASVTKGFVAP